jgi:His/Glu/Gln/Arg/opine family amino acid ABC transporter permease subunit
MSYQWDFGTARNVLPDLLSGVITTVELTATVMALSLIVGVILGFMRLSRFLPLRGFAYAFTELFRTTPLLVQIIWFYFVLPIQLHIVWPTFELGVAALTCNVSSFLAEIFRGGILSIDPRQREAALSTGMTEWRAMAKIVFPQAFRRSIPLLAAMWISLFKDTSLVSVIGIHEIMFHAKLQALDTYRPVEIFTVTALIYFALTFPQSVAVNWLFHRFRTVE